MWWVHRIPGRSVWLCVQLCVQITLQIKIHNTSGRQQVATLLDAISSTYTISKESTQGSQTKYTLLYSIHTYGDTQISGISAVPVWTPAVLNPPSFFPQTFVFARYRRQWRRLTFCPSLTVWLLAPIEQICAEEASDLRLPRSDWLADLVKVTEKTSRSWFTGWL